MINREKYNEMFHYFDSETTSMIFNTFLEQYPDLSGLLERSILDNDLVSVKEHAHKLKGSIGVFWDPDAWVDALIMEITAMTKLVIKNDESFPLLPDTIMALEYKNLLRDSGNPALVVKAICSRSLEQTLAGVMRPFSAENTAKLNNLEQYAWGELYPLFENIRKTSDALVIELKSMLTKLSR